VVLGRWFGIDGELALSLALVRRLREVLFSALALLSLQWARRSPMMQRQERHGNGASYDGRWHRAS
jgi:hypothetical protein